MVCFPAALAVSLQKVLGSAGPLGFALSGRCRGLAVELYILEFAGVFLKETFKDEYCFPVYRACMS